MPLMNRLLDKVGGGINRSAAAGDLEAEVGRLRDDQRLLESALKRALHEIERLRDEVSALRALPVPPIPRPAPPPPTEIKPAAKANGHAAAPTNGHVGEPMVGFLAGARQMTVPLPVDERVAEDTDIESVRAKAAGLRLTIDRNECIGCGTCVEHEDGVFHLNDGEGKAYVLRQEGLMIGIQDAIDACPVTCISWKPPHLATD